MKDYTAAVVVTGVILVGLFAVGFLIAPHLAIPEIEPGRAYLSPDYEEPIVQKQPSKFLQKAAEDPGNIRFY